MIWIILMQNLLYQWCVYSLVPKLSHSLLRKGEYPKNIACQPVTSVLADHDIVCLVEGMDHFHYKFTFAKQSPFVVYAMGDLSILDSLALSIVWPRLKTSYGEKVLQELFSFLAGTSVVTVSWMAPGIDSLAHKLSLQNNIPTIAVLGGWLMHYLQMPKYKKQIQIIVDRGWLVLSDFPLWMKPSRYSFPLRNRLIAALGDWLFLPEAAQWSGSLITLSYAKDLGKPIYGTPHNIFVPSSAWLNKHIANWDVTAVHDLSFFVDSVLQLSPKNSLQEIENENSFFSDAEYAIREKLVLFLQDTWSASAMMLARWVNIPMKDVLAVLTLASMYDKILLEGDFYSLL